jgi:hypothetical protein
VPERVLRLDLARGRPVAAVSSGRVQTFKRRGGSKGVAVGD